MNTYRFTVETAHGTYWEHYLANDLDHAVKKVQTDYIKGDQFVFRTAEKYTAVPRHAVMGVTVEKIPS